MIPVVRIMRIEQMSIIKKNMITLQEKFIIVAGVFEREFIPHKTCYNFVIPEGPVGPDLSLSSNVIA